MCFPTLGALNQVPNKNTANCILSRATRGAPYGRAETQNHENYGLLALFSNRLPPRSPTRRRTAAILLTHNARPTRHTPDGGKPASAAPRRR